MSIVVIIFTFVTLIFLGPLLIIFGFLAWRRRSINKRDLQTIRDEIAHLRADIIDIKEQLADFIIKTN